MRCEWTSEKDWKCYRPANSQVTVNGIRRQTCLIHAAPMIGYLAGHIRKETAS